MSSMPHMNGIANEDSTCHIKENARNVETCTGMSQNTTHYNLICKNTAGILRDHMQVSKITLVQWHFDVPNDIPDWLVEFAKKAAGYSTIVECPNLRIASHDFFLAEAKIF